MDNIIEVKNVFYEYTDEDVRHTAVNGVSFAIERGSFTVILGHNGSGKSTLAKMLNGLLKPTSGEVLVDGINTANEETEIEVKRRVGMVFQNPDNQLVASIVEEDVAFGPENLGLEPSVIRERVDEALKSVGMYEFRESTPHHLSGGQKQRIAIAGIIAMQPECLILDEPTAMLDPVGRTEIIKTLHKLNKEKNILRQNHLSGYVRRENDAEHALHMAIMIYLLKEYSNNKIDVAKTIIMALIHDVVEIDAGDTENGYCAVLIDGCAVGGGKVSSGRCKNHYPKGLRNKMDN